MLAKRLLGIGLLAMAFLGLTAAANAQALRDGMEFPDFSEPDMVTGKTIRLSDFRGKVVLVDFWASDCVPCVQHVPELIEFNKRYHDRGVEIVGLSLESGYRAQHLRAFVEMRDGLDWPIGYDAPMAYEVMDINGTPTYLLYDRSGRSVWGGHSLDGLEDAVVKLLAEK
jgi:thiol-disulfide isomerase/thioredoxin